mmetsp:Transcript_11764/g.33175  ORF Transcript_11764/g.33175 Transcript_11764/m.33175 type:complete len:248 (+) Transcript_11764:322-1065(+)
MRHLHHPLGVDVDARVVLLIGRRGLPPLGGRRREGHHQVLQVVSVLYRRQSARESRQPVDRHVHENLNVWRRRRQRQLCGPVPELHPRHLAPNTQVLDRLAKHQPIVREYRRRHGVPHMLDEIRRAAKRARSLDPGEQRGQKLLVLVLRVHTRFYRWIRRMRGRGMVVRLDDQLLVGPRVLHDDAHVRVRRNEQAQREDQRAQLQRHLTHILRHPVLLKEFAREEHRRLKRAGRVDREDGEPTFREG